MDLQPTLQNETIKAIPLLEEHFESLYKVASDPLIWEQHPNPDRYKREVFQNFFRHAIESKGAFLILDAATQEVIGSTRFYDHNKINSSVLIGYTFYARSHWGGKFNHALKHLMLNHAFQSVDKVYFHIGANNFRSQKSIEKLGAIKNRELDVAYAGEEVKTNFEYKLDKADWNPTQDYRISN